MAGDDNNNKNTDAGDNTGSIEMEGLIIEPGNGAVGTEGNQGPLEAGARDELFNTLGVEKRGLSTEDGKKIKVETIEKELLKEGGIELVENENIPEDEL